jgi:class 3 adenylate cyclase
VIKTIGDSIMAQFSDPKSAVQAAVEIQWLFELNAALPEPKRAHRNVS